MPMTVTHPAPNSSTLSANTPPTIPIGEVLPLEMLQQGETGVVMELVGADEQVHRLKELGLREGVTISVIKRGEPSLIAINDQRLSLRLDPTLMILVEMK